MRPKNEARDDVPINFLQSLLLSKAYFLRPQRSIETVVNIHRLVADIGRSVNGRNTVRPTSVGAGDGGPR